MGGRVFQLERAVSGGRNDGPRPIDDHGPDGYLPARARSLGLGKGKLHGLQNGG